MGVSDTREESRASALDLGLVKISMYVFFPRSGLYSVTRFAGVFAETRDFTILQWDEIDYCSIITNHTGVCRFGLFPSIFDDCH